MVIGQRTLSPTEHRLLTELLAHDVDGADLLRAQLADARVASNCDCGCGSIGFASAGEAVQPDEVRSTLFPVEADVLDDDGEVIGGLLLFVRDGRLFDLEVFSVGHHPLPMPDVSHVRWISHR